MITKAPPSIIAYRIVVTLITVLVLVVPTAVLVLR